MKKFVLDTAAFYSGYLTVAARDNCPGFSSRACSAYEPARIDQRLAMDQRLRTVLLMPALGLIGANVVLVVVIAEAPDLHRHADEIQPSAEGLRIVTARQLPKSACSEDPPERP